MEMQAHMHIHTSTANIHTQAHSLLRQWYFGIHLVLNVVTQ